MSWKSPLSVPSGMLSARRSGARRAAVIVATGLVAIAPAMLAQADEVTGAITGVNISQETAQENSKLQLTLTWAVPDSATSGETFSLTLPDELRAVNGASFALLDPSGAAVANATVAGQVVTFTLTPFVDDHVDVHGTAWFTVKFADSVEPGPGLVLEFIASGTVFRDTINVTGVVPHDYSTSGTKWQTWANGAANNPPRPARDVILWAIAAPRVTEQTARGTVTFIDEPGPGQAIDCDAIQGFWASKNAGGLDKIGTFGADRYTKTCSANRLELTMQTYASDVDKIPYLLGWSYLTDSTLTEYDNDATVKVSTGGTYVVRHVLEAAAGGAGQGQTPASPTGTPTGSGTLTTSATPTDSGTPTETGTPTGSGTPTETASPTQTSTATPTQTSTASPTQTSTASPTQTSTASPTQTSTASPTQTSTASPTQTSTASPTQTSTASPPTQVPTQSATPAPTPTGSATQVPTASASPTRSPASATSVPTPVGGGTPTTPTSGGTPSRIDTGLPGDAGIDPWLVGAGAALIGATGVGLLVVGRRRSDEDDPEPRS